MHVVSYSGHHYGDNETMDINTTSWIRFSDIISFSPGDVKWDGTQGGFTIKNY